MNTYENTLAVKLRRFRHIAALSAGALLVPSQASAWSHVTHQRITELSWEVMAAAAHPNDIQGDNISGLTLVARPDGATQAEWTEYLAQVAEAVEILPNVKAGIDSPKAAASECARDDGAGGTSRLYPSGDGVGECRLGELAFAPTKEWAHLDTCQADPDYVPEGIYSGLPIRFEGMNLGRLAIEPDDDMGETRIWYRVHTGAFLGNAWDIATDAWETALFAVLAGPACLVSLLIGNSCLDGLEETEQIIDDTNLIQELQGSIPGIAPTRTLMDTPMMGFWHFVHVERQGEYNSVAPLHYDFAGPLDHGPGGFDVAFSIVGDIAGIGLQVSHSTGVRRYELTPSETETPDASRYRTTGNWQASNIGHIEMNPLTNFAQWGWDQFESDPTTLRFLARPLHALGDITVPAHVVGSSGWGHQPLEIAAEDHWPELVLIDPTFGGVPDEDLDAQLDQARRILVDGFRWWQHVREFRLENPEWGQMPIRPWLMDIGNETLNDGKVFLNDEASNSHLLQELGAYEALSAVAQGATNASFALFNQALAAQGLPPVTAPDASVRWQNPFEAHLDGIRERIEASSGAQVAFLTFVGSEFAIPLDPTDETPCAEILNCPTETPHWVGGQCRTCPADEVLASSGACDTSCEPDEQNMDGRCVASCSGRDVEVESTCLASCNGGLIRTNRAICDEIQCPQMDQSSLLLPLVCVDSAELQEYLDSIR